MSNDFNVPANHQVPGTPTNPTFGVDQVTIVAPPRKTIKQGEIQMADVDSTVLANEIGTTANIIKDGQVTLASEIAAVRHDVGLAESNVRGDVGLQSAGINKNIGDASSRLEKAVGDNRYSIAAEAAALSKQIGAEACGINQKIGDARREAAAETADIRYDVATRAGDIRHELQAGFCDTNANVLREGQDNIKATLNARHDVLTKVDQTGDRLSDKVGSTTDQIRDKLWSLNRDLVDTKTQVQTGFVGVTKDVELNALKVQLDAAKNVTYLSDKIERDGEKTRALINDLKYHDLNRGLVERNAELVECEADRRHWRHTAEQNQFQGQWAQLQSQIQAFASQLQETRQGMVNFGTMAGVGQSSTSNNVR